MTDDNLEPLVEMYGGRDGIEAGMQSAAMEAIAALKATEQLGQALRDVLRDWSQMSIVDAARTHVERMIHSRRLHDLARELGQEKVQLREAQAAARRDPLSVPPSWQEHRDWYRLVQTIS